MKAINIVFYVCLFLLGTMLNVSWPAHVRAAALDRCGSPMQHFGDDGIIMDGERNRSDSERGH
jgi:hypothetical protein